MAKISLPSAKIPLMPTTTGKSSGKDGGFINNFDEVPKNSKPQPKPFEEAKNK
jgi:hypothetical protein